MRVEIKHPDLKSEEGYILKSHAKIFVSIREPVGWPDAICFNGQWYVAARRYQGKELQRIWEMTNGH